MKLEVNFTFVVEYSIRDVSKQLGKTPEEIAELDRLDLMDLFSEGARNLNSGEIEVSDEYFTDPEYCDWTDELYARFLAYYSVVVGAHTKTNVSIKLSNPFMQKI